MFKVNSEIMSSPAPAATLADREHDVVPPAIGPAPGFSAKPSWYTQQTWRARSSIGGNFNRKIISVSMGKSSLNKDLNGKGIYKWGIFRCYI